MKNAKKHFDQNIERVKHLGYIYQTLRLEGTEIDLNDILRTQYVMLVSALDHFIHEIVRIGMLETYNNSRKPTKVFQDFILTLDKKILFKKAIMEEKNNQWLDYQIRVLNGYKSFQQADKISEAMQLVVEYNIWSKISINLTKDENDLKKQLNFIIDRRNQIAHEADIEPIYKELRPINVDDVNNSIEFVIDIAEAILEGCLLPHSE